MADTRQFLFRLICTPERSHITRSILAVGTWPTNELHPFGVSTIDTIVSLPPVATDLITQANHIVQAYSILCVDNAVFLVAVFELFQDKPADQDTPVMVLHGFNNQDTDNLPYALDDLTQANWKNLYILAPLPTYQHNDNIPLQGYASYNLKSVAQWNLSYDNTKPELYRLSLSRECESGRPQKHMVPRALDPADVLGYPGNTLKLRTDAACWALRAPLYRQWMNLLPFQHSGYHLQPDGSVKLGRIAKGDFIPAGVTIMATQAKQLYRRKRAHSIVLQEWFRTTGHVMTMFQYLDKLGYTGPVFTGVSGPVLLTSSYTYVQQEFIRKNLTRVVEFINLVGVAQGNNTLLLSEPHSTEATRTLEFNSIKTRLTNLDGSLSQVVYKNKTQNAAVFNALHFVTGDIIRIINEYQKQLVSLMTAGPGATGESYAIYLESLINIQNELVEHWEVIQSLLYKLLSLLLTWQLTLDLHENGHATDPAQSKDLVSNLRLPQWYLDLRPNFKPPITSWTSTTTGRFATHVPAFNALRLWPGYVYPTGLDESIAAAERAANIANANATRTAALNERIAARTTRQARRAAEMAAILDDYDTAVPPWQVQVQGAGVFLNPDRLWYNQYAIPMDAELRLRSQLAAAGLNTSGIVAQPKRPVGESYQFQGPGDPAEFITAAPPYDQAVPALPVARWIRRTIDGTTVTVRRVYTLDGYQDTNDLLSDHVATYTDTQHWQEPNLQYQAPPYRLTPPQN